MSNGGGGSFAGQLSSFVSVDAVDLAQHASSRIARGDAAASCAPSSCSERSLPGQHGADRLDSEPFLVVIDERDYHGKRGSNLFDPLRIRRRRPRAPTRIDIGLLHPPAQRVRIHPDPRPIRHHRAVQGQLMILIADFVGPSGSPAHATQPDISSVLPRKPLSSGFRPVTEPGIREISAAAAAVFGRVGCGGSWRPLLTDRPFP
jgi:hypothetical protein